MSLSTLLAWRTVSPAWTRAAYRRAARSVFLYAVFVILLSVVAYLFTQGVTCDLTLLILLILAPWVEAGRRGAMKWMLGLLILQLVILLVLSVGLLLHGSGIIPGGFVNVGRRPATSRDLLWAVPFMTILALWCLRNVFLTRHALRVQAKLSQPDLRPICQCCPGPVVFRWFG
jgi:hypothetical protein